MQQSGCLPTSRWGFNDSLPTSKAAVLSTATRSAKMTDRSHWVRFELVAPDARTVFLAGSFNDWNPKATPLMRLHDRKWAKELWLPAGRYEYLFIVDGQWTADPKARDYVPNPFGGCNSVLKVE